SDPKAARRVRRVGVTGGASVPSPARPRPLQPSARSRPPPGRPRRPGARGSRARAREPRGRMSLGACYFGHVRKDMSRAVVLDELLDVGAEARLVLAGEL